MSKRRCPKEVKKQSMAKCATPTTSGCLRNSCVVPLGRINQDRNQASYQMMMLSAALGLRQLDE